MPRLQTFTFDIVTYMDSIQDDIQGTFLNGRYGEMVYLVEYYWETLARSHIYSLPYMIDEMFQTSNHFHH